MISYLLLKIFTVQVKQKKKELKALEIHICIHVVGRRYTNDEKLSSKKETQNNGKINQIKNKFYSEHIESDIYFLPAEPPIAVMARFYL